ncbi:hypothetical protein GPECTOR_130g566 [Gonium pectorale]|uniref:Uncharacterized protein n=1 Tax=Gonium pectorale TaxID=33097 RepID=A0A150FZG2_GONPE|nr:hypothetical protein GPECTOR_130g566 [Gonium pectorale]|eukprot:KXZ42605.1 hypothetical protein GPECTOR_130g566 [Gonium pectorale]
MASFGTGLSDSDDEHGNEVHGDDHGAEEEGAEPEETATAVDEDEDDGGEEWGKESFSNLPEACQSFIRAKLRHHDIVAFGQKILAANLSWEQCFRVCENTMETCSLSYVFRPQDVLAITEAFVRMSDFASFASWDLSTGDALTEADGQEEWHADFLELKNIVKASGFLAKLNQVFAQTFAAVGLKWAHFSVVWTSQNSLTVTPNMSEEDKATAQKYNTYKLFTSWLDTFIRKVSDCGKWTVKDVMASTIPGLTTSQKQLIISKSIRIIQYAMTNTQRNKYHIPFPIERMEGQLAALKEEANKATNNNQRKAKEAAAEVVLKELQEHRSTALIAILKQRYAGQLHLLSSLLIS